MKGLMIIKKSIKLSLNDCSKKIKCLASIRSFSNYNKHIKGFTIIELLITVAIIGIIVAIAIPNMMNAWEKARQKRSMADLRSWGLAINSYFVDHGFFPFGNAGPVSPSFYLYQIILNTNELNPPPYKDGWDTNFYYWPGGDSPALSQTFTIASLGKDKTIDSVPVPMFKCFQCDIRFRNGKFFTKPEGPQIDYTQNTCDPANCSAH
jgi:prepilin-type N-terminal cleavage/methylation domain-containing protein